MMKKVKNYFFKSKKRIFFAAIIAVVLVILGVKLFSSSKPAKIYTVRAQSFANTVSASGRVTAGKSVELKFLAPSKVTWIGVKKGDHVSAYQGLASLDTSTLEKNLKQKLLDYSATRWDFQQLQDDNNVDGNPLAKITLTDAERRILEKSQFGLDRSVLDVEIADLARQQAVLVTPIEGTVVDDGSFVTGENLSSNDVVTSSIKVVDLSTMYFEAKVDEVDYAKIRTGQKVNVTIDAFPDQIFTGTVSYVGEQGVKSSSGSINILVNVSLDPYTENLVTDLNGEAKFVISEVANAVVIPNEYIFYKSGNPFVKIVRGGKMSDRAITVGPISGNNTLIKSGLSLGDRLAL
jgi:RND family efflux transporter MFP subunit